VSSEEAYLECPQDFFVFIAWGDPSGSAVCGRLSRIRATIPVESRKVPLKIKIKIRSRKFSPETSSITASELAPSGHPNFFDEPFRGGVA
jgi:hypothetical protein